MCDFFWLSPANQGDLSDVVRASLQQLPTVATPAAAASSHESLGASHDPRRKTSLCYCKVTMKCTCSSSSSCDPFLLQSSPSYPQPETLQMEGLIRHVMLSGPPPQLLGAAGVVEGECHVAAPETDEHGLDMAVMDAHPHAPALQRRKSQTKKVVCIPAPTAAPPGVGGRPSTSGEVVPSDLWAWRKYGQKPIMGSPYPRGYYRCSSSKGCSARKQVERSHTDPSMLVITYTSDHNHPWLTQRNELAGSTRSAATSSAKSHGHHQHHSSTAAGVPPPPPRRHHTTSIVDDGVTLSSTCDDVHQQQQVPKQEVLYVMDHPGPAQDAAADHDLDMFADMDVGALNILSASNFNSTKQQQQHANANDDDDHLEQDDKQQLFDPFSSSVFDWVGASFGIGDANKCGCI